jgi:hypothetical protein
MHRLGQDNRPGNSRFPPPPRDAAAALLPYQLHFDFFPNAFIKPKLYTLPLASGQRSALIQLAEGRYVCLESRSGGHTTRGTCDSQNDDFLLVLFL